MTTLVRVRDLVKFFPLRGSRDTVKAVNEITFEIPRGRTLGLIGESGSGKTTVARCLLKLIEPTAGEIYFDGQLITDLREREFRLLRKRMQLVFQDPYASLNPRMTGLASVGEPLRLIPDLSRDERIERAREMMRKVELTDDEMELYPHQMSGGQQQRVGIARAIVTDPDFIVLDEPTSALDLTVRGRITDLLIGLQEELGLSYLYVSHDLSTVEYICHDVAIMYLGKIVEYGSKEVVFNSPRHPYSKALLSSVMYPDPHFQRPRYELKGEIPSPIDLPSGCALHPRCPEAVAECGLGLPPEMIQVGSDQYAACIHMREHKLTTLA